MNISEVSKKYDISTDTLRYYEKIGLIPFVTRNKNGIRNYSETDIEWVGFIKCMRAAGLSIGFLIEYMKLFKEGDKTIGARKAILVEQRRQLADRLSEITKTLNILDYKIKVYDTKILEKEKRLSTNKNTVDGK